MYPELIRIHALLGWLRFVDLVSAWRSLFTAKHLALASFERILEVTIMVMGIPGVSPVEVGAQNSIMTIEHPDDRIGGIRENLELVCPPGHGQTYCVEMVVMRVNSKRVVP
jgi:hypothetical protein